MMFSFVYPSSSFITLQYLYLLLLYDPEKVPLLEQELPTLSEQPHQF